VRGASRVVDTSQAAVGTASTGVSSASPLLSRVSNARRISLKMTLSGANPLNNSVPNARPKEIFNSTGGNAGVSISCS
jgi:hypothetical protein